MIEWRPAKNSYTRYISKHNGREVIVDKWKNLALNEWAKNPPDTWAVYVSSQHEQDYTAYRTEEEAKEAAWPHM